VAGVVMMLLDVVIDPLAVRGDRWFLGRIFYYPEGGVYFGVPVSNFVGWMIVGMVGVGGHCWSGWGEHASRRGWPGLQGRGSDTPGLTVVAGGEVGRPFDRYGRRVWPGIALYYAVLAFNLVVTGWIGEWLLLGVGAAVHTVTAVILLNLALRPATRLGLEKQRA
jgi:Carotenoid biosynthesis protein